MNFFFKIRLIGIKIANYEYWPYWLFYLPMYFYGLYLALSARSLTYFTAVNPGMNYGGAFDSPKFDTLQKIVPKFVPRGIMIQEDQKNDLRTGDLLKQGLKFLEGIQND